MSCNASRSSRATALRCFVGTGQAPLGDVRGYGVMDVDGIWSGLFAAIVVGALGRLLVRGYQPIGCLLTLLIGLVGAAIGGAIGHAQHWGFWLTLAVQALIAALLVLPFSIGTRDRDW